MPGRVEARTVCHKLRVHVLRNTLKSYCYLSDNKRWMPGCPEIAFPKHLKNFMKVRMGEFYLSIAIYRILILKLKTERKTVTDFN